MTGYRPKAWDSEERVHEMIVDYMRLKHSSVIFRTDFAAGIKLPPWLAMRQKRVQFRRGFPDITIFQPKPVDYFQKHGLFLEVKKKGVSLKKQNGDWSTDHIREQAEMMDMLRAQDYWTAFVCGFDEAIAVIDWYLGSDYAVHGWDGHIPQITLGDLDNAGIGDPF